VKIRQFIWERLSDPFVSWSGHAEYPSTFQQELNDQCGRINFVAALIATFAWLPYIPIDRQLYPGEPLIVAIANQQILDRKDWTNVTQQLAEKLRQQDERISELEEKKKYDESTLISNLKHTIDALQTDKKVEKDATNQIVLRALGTVAVMTVSGLASIVWYLLTHTK
jgi:hypothetical protein